MKTKIDFVNTDLEDLSCHTGATFLVDVRLSEICTGLPDDLTGYTARMVILDSEYQTVATITGSITEPTKGLVSFQMSTTETEALIVGMYKHQIELIQGSTIYRIGQGDFEVTP